MTAESIMPKKSKLSTPHSLREWGHTRQRDQAENTVGRDGDVLHSFFTSSAMAMVILSPKGGFLKVNPSCCRILGYTEEELLRLKVLDVTYRQFTIPESLDHEKARADY